MSSQQARLVASDAELLEGARSGDTDAFAELWRRHYRSAARVARQFTSSIDADDLVSEAYARIFQRVLAGGGPTGAFRPYLYTTIRNLASSWGAASRDVQVDAIEDFEDERIPDDPAAWALDRTLTAKAFRSLPERWQTVLWYTEVEGMDPHEVAPLMGLTANGVAALSYRAREGLRTAWLQAHISGAGTSTDCRWTMSRLGDRARDGLTVRETKRVEQHLMGCARCAVISDEVDEVGSHLAMVLVPLLLGGIAGGALLASLGHSTAAMAAEMIPALPTSVVTAGMQASTISAAPILGGISMGAASGTGALVGTLAIIAAIGGGVTLGVATPGSPLAGPAPSHHASAADHVPVGAPMLPSIPTPSAGGPAADISAVGGVIGGVSGVANGVVNGVVNGVTAPIFSPLTGGAPAATATVDVHLAGTGTPGATVSAQLAAAVATTVVASDGRWAIDLSGLPPTTGANADANVNVNVSQKAGLVNGLLGSLLAPLSLTANSAGVQVTLLN